jgi:metal-responsive CopG/Arc/MetJ family transcriptional regulator
MSKTKKDYTLINFNIPNDLKERFDDLINSKGFSRTSLLNQFVEGWVREEEIKLIQDVKNVNFIKENA